MCPIPVINIETSTGDAKRAMENAQQAYGFVPNLTAVMANAPLLAEAYQTLGGLFEKTSFSSDEKQVIYLAISAENGCDYCMAAHSVIADMNQLAAEVTEAIRRGQPIDDPRLEALRSFTQHLVSERGWIGDDVRAAFLAAGYSETQILEVVLGVGMKTLSNYTNHIAGTPLDQAFAHRVWTKPDA